MASKPSDPLNFFDKFDDSDYILSLKLSLDRYRVIGGVTVHAITLKIPEFYAAFKLQVFT